MSEDVPGFAAKVVDFRHLPGRVDLKSTGPRGARNAQVRMPGVGGGEGIAVASGSENAQQAVSRRLRQRNAKAEIRVEQADQDRG